MLFFESAGLKDLSEIIDEKHRVLSFRGVLDTCSEEKAQLGRHLLRLEAVSEGTSPSGRCPRLSGGRRSPPRPSCLPHRSLPLSCLHVILLDKVLEEEERQLCHAFLSSPISPGFPLCLRKRLSSAPRHLPALPLLLLLGGVAC